MKNFMKPLIQEHGMWATLFLTIEYLKSLNSKEDYVYDLIADLEVALSKYASRYKAFGGGGNF